MYTVNIDAGGTMTDGLIASAERTHTIKVDSTPHDLTVAMMTLIDQATADLGYDSRRDFLDEVSVIRWSSTVTTNVLAQRSGPKVGLLVDAGEHKRLYGDSDSPAVDSLIAEDNICALAAGHDATDVLAAVRNLLEDGVRRVCVSFAGAFADPGRERRAKAIIGEQYPDHVLGAVPVLLGSDMVQSPDDMTRTHFSLINAYAHPALASSLFKAEERLKVEDDWRGTVLVGHTNGGMARIGKTKAVDTIESGPVFGTFAAAYFAREHSLDALACVDVGGTTAKISFVRDGWPMESDGGELFGIPVKTPLQMLRSLALGGGSIVSVDGDSIALGPESMGASPGPACYALGGTNATLTDCYLVLGYVDPASFLDGRRQLDVEQARAVVADNIAKPLNLSVEEAALAVRDRAADMLATLVRRTAAEAGIDTASVPLFAYGGNGPLVAAFAADSLGVERLYASFALGPVFSAFGTAICNVAHVYEQGISASTELGSVAAQVPAVITKLRAAAERDLVSGGFTNGDAQFSAELDRCESGKERIRLPIDGNKITELPETSQAVVRARIEYPVPTHEPEVARREPTQKLIVAGVRQVWLDAQAAELPVYDCTTLAAGDEIDGPAVLGGGSVSCVLLTGWRLTIDAFGNGVMQKGG